MSNETTNSSGSGIGLMGLLFVVFLTLKLLGITAVANWSWWWVTAPLWGGAALAGCIFLLFIVGGLIVYVFKR